MKILIFGHGYLGQRLAGVWPDAVLSDVRIDDIEAVRRELERQKPDAVVNTAGRTGSPNVDWCESHQTETARSNVIGSLALAEACKERDLYLLHLASGCIFYGPSPDPRGWTEADFANPTSLYSRTKYAADLVLSRMPNVGIARLRMPIDCLPNPRNLIDKLSKYAQVVDVENSVTVVEDLIHAARALIEKRGIGVFHVVNPGIMRHKDLLDLYRTYVDPTHACEWIPNDELVTRGLAVKGRSNCILQSDRLAKLGIHLRPIDVALRDTMMKYAENKEKIESGRDPRPVPRTYASGKMKGVILAGGKGTRLAPLTNITNKHLLPIGQKQMVLYPLKTLIDAGIRDILIVTGPDHAGHFMNLLGSGSAHGCRLTYRIQDESGGIPHALALAREFVGHDNVTVILGDNIFEDDFSSRIAQFNGGALTFYKSVPDAHRFGVVEVDGLGNVLSLEEKPSSPKTTFAQAGLYVYDHHVFEIIDTLTPSRRGELEIVDVNNAYLRKRQLQAMPVYGFWSDAGTHESLARANEYANRNGIS